MEKGSFSDFLTLHSKYNLVIKSAVKSEEAIPMIKVVANPRIGPVPKEKSIIAVKRVVTFASMIAALDPLYPSDIACFRALPFNNSSRIRSLIRTLASTAIPIVKTIPAIPGNVKTALNASKIPKMKNMFTNKAILAPIPAAL